MTLIKKKREQFVGDRNFQPKLSCLVADHMNCHILDYELLIHDVFAKS